MARKALVYCRISDDRDGEALGVQRQEADCRRKAADLGWEVVDVHVDNDVSAFTGKRRPGYAAMLDDLKNHVADALIVWKPDRLHRRPVELEAFIDLVEQHGIAIATVAGGNLDLTSSEGRAMARVVGAFARMESEVKSDRTRRKHLELAERGIAVGGSRPFGYEPDKVTIRTAEATLIREAAARVLAGGTVRSICQDWNKRGLVTTKGNRWNQTGVRRLLTAWRTAGVRALGDAPVAYDAWPAILDLDTLTRLRAVLLAPGRTRGGYGPRTHVLTGLLYCGKCGHKLVARPQTGRRRTYVCTSNPDSGGCGGIRIVADDLEDFVSDQMFRHLDSKEFADRFAFRLAEVPAAEDDAVAEVAACEAKLLELGQMWASDQLTRAEWLDARKRVEERLAVARRSITRAGSLNAAAALVGKGEDLRSRWADTVRPMSIDEKHATLRDVVDRVVIKGARPGWNRFDHKRALIDWRL